MELLLVYSLLDYGLDGVGAIVLFRLFAAVVELLNEALQIHQIF